MENKTIPAVFGLNRVLWAAIVQSGIIPNTSNYNGLIPIIPVQEEPQFISAMDSQPGIGSFPYIVYSWHTNTIDAVSWYKTTDMVTYKVYANDQTALRKLVLLITDLFKRYDESAAVVNTYIARKYLITTSGTTGGPDAQLPAAQDGPDIPGYEYRRYHYNYISVVSSSGGSPQTSENDPNTALINLRVNYTDDRNDADLTVPPIV